MSFLALAESKRYLRVGQSDDDALIQSLIDGVEQWFSAKFSTGLTQATQTDQLDGGGTSLRPYRQPVASVTSITDLVTSNVESSDVYALRAGSAVIRDDGSRRALGRGRLGVAYVFSALFGLGRSVSGEVGNDARSGLALAPTDRGWILLGKIAANLVILGVAQAVTALVFALVFDLSLLPVAPALAGIVLLGSLGLCTVGTFFSAIAVQTRFREVMLPLLLLPVLWPLLSAAVRATTALLAGEPVPPEAIQPVTVGDAT